MSVDLRGTCPLDISDETLSALHDEALPAGELRRLTEHVATCPACSERLEGYERTGRLLCDQRLPGPTPALWDDVRASILARRPLPARSQWRAVVSPRFGALSALAAALMVALLFGLVLHSLPNGAATLATPSANAAITATASPTLTPTATATPWPVQTPVPGPQLSWHYYTLPGGYAMDPPTTRLEIAPSDGNTAYVCQEGGTNQGSRVIVTHDRGEHWVRVSDIPAGSTCDIAVDQVDPAVVVSSFFGNVNVSRDGGGHWTHYSQPQQFSDIGPTATLGSRVYALIGVWDQAKSGSTTRLEVSDDGMQTWRPIDGSITDGEVRGFWLNGANGRLLMETLGHFWDSADGGQTWTRVTLPAGSPEDYVVQIPSTGLWYICSVAYAYCTTDGGQTWRALPPLLSGVSGGDAEFSLAIAGDGSLLARVYAMQPGASRSQIELYRLPAGSTQWQVLGSVPTLPPDGLDLYPTFGPTIGGAGVFWALPPGGKGAYSQFYTAPYTP